MPPTYATPADRVAYPETRRESLTETMGGVTFDDPYQWLEDETDEVLQWQAAQNRLAEGDLRSWPGFEPLRRLIDRLSVDTRIYPPKPAGGLWFQQVLLSPDADQPALVVRDRVDGRPRELLDPNPLSAERGAQVSIDWFTPSPDGALVAVGLSEAGNEQSVLHLVDVASGEVMSDRIPFMGMSPVPGMALVSWLPDASGFYYSGGLGPQTETMSRRIFFHKVGAPPPELTAHEEVDLLDTIGVPQVSDDGRYVAAISGDYRLRPFHFLDREAGAGWQPLLDRLAGCHYLGFFHGDEYIALTTDAAPRGRVVAIPLTSPGDRSTWREIVPESDANLRSITKVGGRRILVSDLSDARTRVRVFEMNGTESAEVPAPGPGILMVTGSNASSHLVALTYTAVDTSPALYSYDVANKSLTRLTEPAHQADGITSQHRFASSRDGTRIPMAVVHRADLDLGQPNPTLIYAYGGFNMPHLPRYSPRHLAFVESGGILVLPNLRGGGEYGDEWWEGGRRANKQNTFDDLYCVAESLVTDGIAAPEKLAVEGGSNGGLLTGVAVTQRPDLWAAVVSIVPIYDLFRTVHRDPYGSYDTTHEFGDPRIPEEARWLIGYSPYQNVRPGTAYPATLISAGGRDVRCPPWHSRKLAAALQAATSGDSPIVLRVHDNIGHGPGRPSSTVVLNETEWMGFVMAHLGMQPSDQGGS